MDKATWEERRQRAAPQLLQGEAFTVLCLSEGVSRGWLKKWWVRHTCEAATLFHDDSRRPRAQLGRSPTEIEEVVQLVRLELYSSIRSNSLFIFSVDSRLSFVGYFFQKAKAQHEYRCGS